MVLHYSVKVGEVLGRSYPQPGFTVNGRTSASRFDVTKNLCGSKGASASMRAAFLADGRRCPDCERMLRERMGKS